MKLAPTSTAATDADRLTSLSAPTRDPLWMLARQWQTGGFIADDAGSPVKVQLSTVTGSLSMNGAAVTGPLQPLVEAEAPADPHSSDTGERVRVASELFRRLTDAALPAGTAAALRTAWSAAYPMTALNAGATPAVLARRTPDVDALATALGASLQPDGSGIFPTLPGMPQSAPIAATVQQVVRDWYAWLRRRTAGASGDPTPPHWDGQQLAYTATAQSVVPTGTVTLTADGYDGTGLDWFSFDRSTLPSAPPASGAPVSVRATPVAYPGMPQPGYWTMEDGDVHLNPRPDSDPGQQLLALFAHSYANDWFVIPVTVPDGICLIADLQVTDTFGKTVHVPASAAVDGPGSRWNLWELSSPGTATSDGAMGLRLFPPVAAPPLEGPALEDVLVVRDEMADLSWVVELTTRDGDGTTVDRYRRWLARKPAQDPSFDPARKGDARWYRLGTTLPDFWYPLVPVDGSPPAVLALADVPPGAKDVSDAEVQGRLVPHAGQTKLADQIVTRAGIRVTRADRLVYSGAGRTVWRARASGFDVAESSSGLRFDILAGPAAPDDLTRSGDMGPALRTPPAPLTGTGQGPSALRDWRLSNTTSATTLSWVEPTTRPGGWGWMLHVTTTGTGCGLVQQWAAAGTGPAAATASAWVYVLSGTVHIGSGDGATVGADAVSTGHDRWELIEAVNGHSPVNQVLVASDGGPAEFLVDMVSVVPRPSAAAPGTH